MLPPHLTKSNVIAPLAGEIFSLVHSANSPKSIAYTLCGISLHLFAKLGVNLDLGLSVQRI